MYKVILQYKSINTVKEYLYKAYVQSIYTVFLP